MGKKGDIPSPRILLKFQIRRICEMAKLFGHAPITHALTLAVVVQTLTSSKIDGFNLNSVLSGNYLNLVTPFLTYGDRVQLAVGSILMYILRIFEQQFGSRKFGAMVFFSWVLAIATQVGIVVACENMGVKQVKPATGPFFLVFALLVLYYHSVPNLSPSQYSFLGLTISEKTWTYILGVQLMFSAQMHSAVAALIGLFLGVVYYSNQLGIQGWRLPGPLEKLISLPFALMGESTSDNNERQPRDGANDDNSMMPEGDNPRADRQRQPSWSEATQERLHDFGGLGAAIEPPTEEQIKTITNLGFDRSKAIHALEQCDNNVEQAANYILR